MSISLQGQSSNVIQAWITAVTPDNCPPNAQLFQRKPKILDLCLRFLFSEERAKAAQVNRHFRGAVTHLYGTPTRETGLPLEIFEYVLGFVGQNGYKDVVFLNRAWRQATIKCAIDSHAPSVRFCDFLEKNALLKLQLSTPFQGCNTLQDVRRRISAIKMKIVKELSKLTDNNLIKSQELCGDLVSANFKDVFSLGAERREILRESLRGEWVLHSVNPCFKDDEEIIDATIENHCDMHGEKLLNWMSARLRNKESIMLLAFKRWQNRVHDYIGPELRDNEEFMLAVCPLDKSLIRLASNRLKNTFTFMSKLLHLFKNGWFILNNSGPGLRDNQEFMWAACQQNLFFDNSLVKYASERLRDSFLFMIKIIHQNGVAAAAYIGPKLRDNSVFMLEVCRRDSSKVELIGAALKNNSGFMNAVIRKNVKAAQYIGPQLKDNKEFMLGVCDLDFSAAQFAGLTLRNDSRFMAQVIRKNVKAAQYIGPELRDNERFMTLLCKVDPSAYQFASPRLSVLLDVDDDIYS